MTDNYSIQLNISGPTSNVVDEITYQVYTITQEGSATYTIAFNTNDELYTPQKGNWTNGCTEYNGYMCTSYYGYFPNLEPTIYYYLASTNKSYEPSSSCPSNIAMENRTNQTTQSFNLYNYQSQCSSNSINSFEYSYITGYLDINNDTWIYNSPITGSLYFTLSSNIPSVSNICQTIKNGVSNQKPTPLPGSYQTIVNYYSSSSTTSTPLVTITFNSSFSNSLVWSVTSISVTGTNVTQNQLFAALANTASNQYGASSIIYQENMNNISKYYPSLYNLCAASSALAIQIQINEN